jgi:hypothetical protein
LAGLLRVYQNQGEAFLAKVLDSQDSFKDSVAKNSLDGEAYQDSNSLLFNNLTMEVLDKVPPVDRTSLPISQIINIIPRQLFKKELLRLRNLDVFSIDHRVSHSSIYLPASDMYAYLTGILFYEKSADILSPGDANSSKQSAKGTDGAYSTNLYIPKIITLVSRRPMYSEMKNCLNLLLNRVGLEHDIPLENMVKNLIYETTFLKPEFRFNSDFWTMNHLEYND